MSKVDEIADAYEGTKNINDRAYLALVEMTVIARAYERELAKAMTERNVALAKVSKDGRRIAELEAVEERLLAERDAMTARAEKAEQELERQAWKISPAMAQAQIDQLNARAEKAEAKLKIAVGRWHRLIYMESAAIALAKIDAIERGEAT